MPLLPHRFLFRMAHPCRLERDMPRPGLDGLLDLPVECRIDNFAALDEQRNFADVRLAWNDLGIGFQVEVRGKEQPPQGSGDRPRSSDGATLWLDTRDSRASHRASRYCHQFHFLPVGGGPDRDEPVLVQAKINRALHDAPLCAAAAVPFRARLSRGGYLLEAFLPAAVLNGYDAEQNSRLGFYYVVHDGELGEQFLSVGPEFPYWEDPSLWSVLHLQR